MNTGRHIYTFSTVGFGTGPGIQTVARSDSLTPAQVAELEALATFDEPSGGPGAVLPVVWQYTRLDAGHVALSRTVSTGRFGIRSGNFLSDTRIARLDDLAAADPDAPLGWWATLCAAGVWASAWDTGDWTAESATLPDEPSPPVPLSQAPPIDLVELLEEAGIEPAAEWIETLTGVVMRAVADPDCPRMVLVRPAADFGENGWVRRFVEGILRAVPPSVRIGFHFRTHTDNPYEFKYREGWRFHLFGVPETSSMTTAVLTDDGMFIIGDPKRLKARTPGPIGRYAREIGALWARPDLDDAAKADIQARFALDADALSNKRGDALEEQDVAAQMRITLAAGDPAALLDALEDHPLEDRAGYEALYRMITGDRTLGAVERSEGVRGPVVARLARAGLDPGRATPATRRHALELLSGFLLTGDSGVSVAGRVSRLVALVEDPDLPETDRAAILALVVEHTPFESCPDGVLEEICRAWTALPPLQIDARFGALAQTWLSRAAGGEPKLPALPEKMMWRYLNAAEPGATCAERVAQWLAVVEARAGDPDVATAALLDSAVRAGYLPVLHKLTRGMRVRRTTWPPDSWPRTFDALVRASYHDGESGVAMLADSVRADVARGIEVWRTHPGAWERLVMSGGDHATDLVRGIPRPAAWFEHARRGAASATVASVLDKLLAAERCRDGELAEAVLADVSPEGSRDILSRLPAVWEQWLDGGATPNRVLEGVRREDIRGGLREAARLDASAVSSVLARLAAPPHQEAFLHLVEAEAKVAAGKGRGGANSLLRALLEQARSIVTRGDTREEVLYRLLLVQVSLSSPQMVPRLAEQALEAAARTPLPERAPEWVQDQVEAMLTRVLSSSGPGLGDRGEAERVLEAAGKALGDARRQRIVARLVRALAARPPDDVVRLAKQVPEPVLVVWEGERAETCAERYLVLLQSGQLSAAGVDAVFHRCRERLAGRRHGLFRIEMACMLRRPALMVRGFDSLSPRAAGAGDDLAAIASSLRDTIEATLPIEATSRRGGGDFAPAPTVARAVVRLAAQRLCSLPLSFEAWHPLFVAASAQFKQDLDGLEPSTVSWLEPLPREVQQSSQLGYLLGKPPHWPLPVLLEAQPGARARKTRTKTERQVLGRMLDDAVQRRGPELAPFREALLEVVGALGVSSPEETWRLGERLRHNPLAKLEMRLRRMDRGSGAGVEPPGSGRVAGKARQDARPGHVGRETVEALITVRRHLEHLFHAAKKQGGRAGGSIAGATPCPLYPATELPSIVHAKLLKDTLLELFREDRVGPGALVQVSLLVCKEGWTALLDAWAPRQVLKLRDAGEAGEALAELLEETRAHVDKAEYCQAKAGTFGDHQRRLLEDLLLIALDRHYPTEVERLIITARRCLRDRKRWTKSQIERFNTTVIGVLEAMETSRAREVAVMVQPH